MQTNNSDKNHLTDVNREPPSEQPLTHKLHCQRRVNLQRGVQPQPQVIWDSNPDFCINPDLDPDVCWIPPKMLWIHYIVDISHSAKFCTNRLVTV